MRANASQSTARGGAANLYDTAVLSRGRPVGHRLGTCVLTFGLQSTTGGGARCHGATTGAARAGARCEMETSTATTATVAPLMAGSIG